MCASFHTPGYILKEIQTEKNAKTFRSLISYGRKCITTPLGFSLINSNGLKRFDSIKRKYTEAMHIFSIIINLLRKYERTSDILGKPNAIEYSGFVEELVSWKLLLETFSCQNEMKNTGHYSDMYLENDNG